MIKIFQNNSENTKKQIQRTYKSVREYQSTLIILLGIIIIIEIAIIVYRKYHHPEIIIRNSGSMLLSLRKLDINSANVEELSAIPGISRKLAENIVTYRENYHRRFPSRKVFKKPEDLLKVKGISRKILSKITNFITFSATKFDSY